MEQSRSYEAGVSEAVITWEDVGTFWKPFFYHLWHILTYAIVPFATCAISFEHREF